MFDWNKVFSKPAYEFEIKDVDQEITQEFVKKLRTKLNLSQRMFAKILGISEKTIEKWEQGVIPIKRTASRLLFVLERHPEILNDLYIVKREDEVIMYRECRTFEPYKVKKIDEDKAYDSVKFIPEDKFDDTLFLSERRDTDKNFNTVESYI